MVLRRSVNINPHFALIVLPTVAFYPHRRIGVVVTGPASEEAGCISTMQFQILPPLRIFCQVMLAILT